jgi:uncharacterized membrane protein YqiK
MAFLFYLFVIVAILALIAIFVGAMVTRLYRKVPQSQALLVSKTKTIDVTFTGALVIPVVHRAELMDIGVKVVDIEKAGNDGLICRDNIRADIQVSFYVRVNPNADDVRKVAQLVGCANASSQEKLEELFAAKFAEALKTAGKQMDFVELYDKRDHFRSTVINVIGEDLNGYVLDDVAIEYLEQTPMDRLDPSNVFDAEGIRKITEITSREKISANSFRREAEKQIKQKDVETQQAVFEMDRQEKAAEFRAIREMATTKSREEAAASLVESEERLKAETSRLRTDEQLQVQTENLQREVMVATKNRERVIAVEEERIQKARQLESVAREVETLAARKELETEMTKIAEISKARIAVERTVAEQEESIKTLRVMEEANRNKDAAVVAAGGEAEATLITTIKAAEASEKAAEHGARERMVKAEAMKNAAELESTAKIRLAEGVRAEAAAEGLAAVEVRRADAAAIEQVGVANARVKEVDADAMRKVGEADGAAIEARLRGEAAGLTVKAEAMKQLEGVGKEYDLAVRRIDADTQVRMAGVNANRDLGMSQADAIGAALAKADINIVGGTDMFVDRVLGAVSMGKAVEGFANSSTEAGMIANPYVSGDKDLLELLSSAVAGMGTGGVAQLSLARLMNGLADRLGGDDGATIRSLVSSLQAKGIDNIDVNRIVGR